MEREIRIPIGRLSLAGSLSLPAAASTLVLFAHGSGSSRRSPRNRAVAVEFQRAGLGTLLFDLLTAAEDQIYENRFDIDLLARRLESATEWVRAETSPLALGFFGASTGAAAALQAAASLGDQVQAVVSRGGRPDLAHEALRSVRAPTLLIVGQRDLEVLDLNRRALEQLQCVKRLSIVEGATHLFEEPGAIEEVSRLATEWFQLHLAAEVTAGAGVHGHQSSRS